MLCQTKVFNQAKIELPITFKPAEQNLVTCLAPTLQRLAGWQAIQSIHSNNNNNNNNNNNEIINVFIAH